jgi:hypothetical protein
MGKRNSCGGAGGCAENEVRKKRRQVFFSISDKNFLIRAFFEDAGPCRVQRQCMWILNVRYVLQGQQSLSG